MDTVNAAASEKDALIDKLQSELLEAHCAIAELTNSKPLFGSRENARASLSASTHSSSSDAAGEADAAGDAEKRFSVRMTPARYFDKDYVERLEKNYMDAKEELEDLRQMLKDINNVKDALSAALGGPDEDED